MKTKEKGLDDIHTSPAAVTKNTAKTEFTSFMRDLVEKITISAASGWNF